MVKVCICCGLEFETKRSNKIYCNECAKLSPSKRKMYERATQQNMRTYYDVGMQNVQYICKNCGKVFTKIRYPGEPVEQIDFCSKECISEAKAKESEERIRSTKCVICGKPMLSTNDIRDTHGKAWCCSPECKEAYKWRVARLNGTVKICPVCGKEFIGNKTYCSIQCYDTFRANMKSNREQYEKEHKDEIIQKKIADQQMLKAKRTQKAKKVTQEKEELQRNKELKTIQENGLCAICCTPYSNCERMKTNFRLKPEGSIYNGNKIVKCPKFNSTKVKYLDINNFR